MPTCTQIFRHLGLALLACGLSLPLVAEPLPAQLAGTWRVTRSLPTKNVSCWGEAEIKRLVGTTLTYRSDSLRWRGGRVPLLGVVTRSLTEKEFREENSGSGEFEVDFAQVGIRAKTVLEVDLQHDDADITGCSTEVPGDTVMLAGPNRIVFGVSGAFFEATRAVKR